MIKAVILDYGGTMVNSNVNFDVAFERSVERLLIEGIEIAQNDFFNAFMDTAEWRRIVNATGREIDSHEFYSHVLGILGHKVSRDVTEELERYLFESADPEWLDDIEKLLTTLSEDYKVALLSNAWLEAPRQLLRDMGYGRWFDVMVVSYDIEIAKPDPRIFQHTLNLLGVEPHEAVMVGDSIIADMEGATNAGLESVWVDYEGTGEWPGYKVSVLSELPLLIKKL
jgi:HAD superfamily hydrolase (TIGR01549 family)